MGRFISRSQRGENMLYAEVTSDELAICSMGLNSCPLLPQSGRLPLCLCHPPYQLLYHQTPGTSLHLAVALCAHTSTPLILQVYPQPFGVEFRRSCLDLDKWGRKVEGGQDKMDDSSLPVLSQKLGHLLCCSCQFVPDTELQNMLYQHITHIQMPWLVSALLKKTSIKKLLT